MNCFVCPAAGSRPAAAGTGSPVRRAAPRRRSNGVVNIACFRKKCEQFLKIYLPILDVSFLSALRAGSGLFVSPHVRQFLPPVRACAPPKQRAGPLRRLPPAAAGAARLTRRDGHASLSQAPPIYRHAKRPKSFIHFVLSQKIISRRVEWGQKFFASWWDGDETGEKRAAARWENRSVVPQGMGIKMRRNRAGLPGGLAKTDRKRSARRGETGAAVGASGRNRGCGQRVGEKPPHGSRTGRARAAGCILFLQRADACAKKALKFQSRKTGGAKGGRPCRSAAA